MPEVRTIRYTLLGNYWVAPGRTPIPAPPFVPDVDPPVDPPPPTTGPFLTNDPGSLTDGPKRIG